MSELAAYVQAIVGDTPVTVNRMQDSPDQAVMVSIVHGGKGFLVDGAFQEVVIHTRSRSTTDPLAEALALSIDAGLLNSTPAQMGSTYVRNICPVGGPPCYFERDVENRTTYFCDYMLEVQR